MKKIQGSNGKNREPARKEQAGSSQMLPLSPHQLTSGAEDSPPGKHQSIRRTLQYTRNHTCSCYGVSFLQEGSIGHSFIHPLI